MPEHTARGVWLGQQESNKTYRYCQHYAAVSSCFEAVEAVGVATPSLEKTHNQWANSLTSEKKGCQAV